MLTDLIAGKTVSFSDCGDETEQVPAQLVALDWNGGSSPIFPNRSFASVDLSSFETLEGETLADDAEAFREDVRLQVTKIYCESANTRIRVIDARDSASTPATTVIYTQELSPRGGVQIGEGEYDPCDRQHDNSAVIFGEQIRLLGGPRSYEQWVAAFANVTAHEIGHTLGFPHVSRDDHPELGRSLFVELMLTSHTMHEIVREHRFVVNQTNCPDDPQDAATFPREVDSAMIDYGCCR